MAARYSWDMQFLVTLEWISDIKDSRFEHTARGNVTAWCVPWETSESLVVRLQTWIREKRIFVLYHRLGSQCFTFNVRHGCDKITYKGNELGRPDATPLGRLVTDPGMRQIGVDGNQCVTNCCCCCPCCVLCGPTQRALPKQRTAEFATLASLVEAGGKFSFTVPAGAQPGWNIPATAPNGARVDVTIPPGAAPGTSIMVRY